MVHVLLELADGLCGEGVRDRLALAGVFSAVPRVEEAAADGDEGVIVFTEEEFGQYQTLLLLYLWTVRLLTSSASRCHARR